MAGALAGPWPHLVLYVYCDAREAFMRSQRFHVTRQGRKVGIEEV